MLNVNKTILFGVNFFNIFNSFKSMYGEIHFKFGKFLSISFSICQKYEVKYFVSRRSYCTCIYLKLQHTTVLNHIQVSYKSDTDTFTLNACGLSERLKSLKKEKKTTKQQHKNEPRWCLYNSQNVLME